MSALHFASSTGNTESIELLLEAGADVAAVDNMIRVDSKAAALLWSCFASALYTVHRLKAEVCWSV